MEEPKLPPFINPNNFPAKLWWLVNSPRFRSVSWDARGEGLLVDQPLFECELLGAGPGCAAGRAGDGAAGAANIFKTKNFTSFIRQLNLYGFRKSPHFRRDRPDLLIHLKRLTSANKAKLAAGLEVTSRPPNRFQQLLGTSLQRNLLLPPSTLGKADSPAAGLLTVGQFQQPYHRDSFFPYSYIPTSSLNHSTLPTKSVDQTPVPTSTWERSLGLLPGHEASPAFPDKGVASPVLQRFPTEVTYTLQPVVSLLPLQQGSQTIATSLPPYSSYTSSMQYSQAYYPTAPLQCCSPPAHVDPLTGCASPAASIYTQCGFSQGPPIQSPYATEYLPSSWPCNTCDENKKTGVNLEAVFQIVDEMHSSPKAEMVKVEPVEIQCSTPQSNRGQPVLVNSEISDAPSSADESQLESLTPVASDTSFLVAADQAVTCSPSQPSEFLCAPHTAVSVESAAAEIAQESVTTLEVHQKPREQPDHCLTQSSIMFVQEGPFSPEQNTASVKYESSTSETEERPFTSATEPGDKSVEETDYSAKPRCRKRRHSSQNSKSPDLHLLVDIACKQGYFQQEETRE
ncbi:heat shock factor protein 5 [Phalacrocorax carbo]|uniref:heat shock factor protein 5 n=1 Tax=Phalacrocorax carbo TaxID=9209 RepID=UPI0031196653